MASPLAIRAELAIVMAKLIPLPPVNRDAPSCEAPAPLDRDLIQAAANGDSTALGTLYDRHHLTVWRFIARSLSTSGPETDDLVQSTFLEAWRSAPRFAGRSTVRTWLLGIAHNLVRRHIRDKTRRRAALTVLATEPRLESRSERQLDHGLMLSRLQAALQELSPEHRAAFVLCDLEQTRGIEAARILGVRPGTLWRRLHEARKTLRQALDGESP